MLAIVAVNLTDHEGKECQWGIWWCARL